MKLNDFGASADLKIKQKTKMVVKNRAAYEHENLTKIGFKVEKKVKYFEVILSNSKLFQNTVAMYPFGMILRIAKVG